MENLGLLLAEIGALVLILLSAFAVLSYRRRRWRREPFSDRDRQLFFGRARWHLTSADFRLRLARAILAATAASGLIFTLLKPLGPAIVSVTLLLAGAAIVRWMLMSDS